MSLVFDTWDKATDERKTTYILGVFNKNWLDMHQSATLLSFADICCLTQTITESHRAERVKVIPFDLPIMN